MALHAHDCFRWNWPVLEHAIIGNIVPDFPLINNPSTWPPIAATICRADKRQSMWKTLR